MSTVKLEILPWLNSYWGAKGSRRVVLEMEIIEGSSIRELLEEIAAQSPEFKAVLFNAQTGRLAGHIAVIVNGRLVELAGGLDARLSPGDTIQLMPGFSGG